MFFPQNNHTQKEWLTFRRGVFANFAGSSHVIVTECIPTDSVVEVVTFFALEPSQNETRLNGL